VLRGLAEAALVLEGEEQLLAAGVEAAPRLVGDALGVSAAPSSASTMRCTWSAWTE
jgi:hypothetical protein